MLLYLTNVFDCPLMVEYWALRRICGAYHGSSHEKLGMVAAVETLETKLNDISAS